MSRLIASFLVALAMFLSPLAMVGGMAMAHSPTLQTDDGCAGSHHRSTDGEKSDMKMSCAIACAALPGIASPAREQPLAIKGKTVMVPAQVLLGIWPESETPPPRAASEI